MLSPDSLVSCLCVGAGKGSVGQLGGVWPHHFKWGTDLHGISMVSPWCLHGVTMALIAASNDDNATIMYAQQTTSSGGYSGHIGTAPTTGPAFVSVCHCLQEMKTRSSQLPWPALTCRQKWYVRWPWQVARHPIGTAPTVKGTTKTMLV